MEDLIELSEAFGTFYLQSTRILDSAMAAAGVSLARYRVLRFVEARQPTLSRDIADYFGFAPRTVTEALDALERLGLIQRTVDPDDRRSKPLILTAAGKDAIARSDVPRTEVVGKIFGALTTTERQTLAATLRKLEQGLATLSTAD